MTRIYISYGFNCKTFKTPSEAVCEHVVEWCRLHFTERCRFDSPSSPTTFFFAFLSLLGIPFKKLFDCSIRVADCSIRVYQSFLAEIGRSSLTGSVGNWAVFELIGR